MTIFDFSRGSGDPICCQIIAFLLMCVLFIYYPCVSFHTQPHAGTTHLPTSPLLAPSRHLFIRTTRRLEPALPCSPASHPFHASTVLYTICTLIRSVEGGRDRDLILERFTSANPHLCFFGEDAAALLSDLPLRNGSGLNAEEDEAMWGAYHPGFSGGILTLYEPSLFLLLIMGFITSRLNHHLFRCPHYIKLSWTDYKMNADTSFTVL